MRITNPQALRALAHPLRLDLLELLGGIGPATAATCARYLGTSQASCSFHLRQLAKYGYVEQAPPSGDRRERPWRAVSTEQEWSSADGGPAATEVERVFVERETARMLAWIDRKFDEPEVWRRSAFLAGATVPMTADELRQVDSQLREILQPFAARLADGSKQPTDVRFVRLLLSGAPLPHTRVDECGQPVAPERE